jgi:predicted transposase YdaD
MGKLDITLRDIISNIPHKFVEILTGKRAVKILDNTFPSVKERKADLILEMEDGSIFHLELQTNNDKDMHYRMLNYYGLIKARYKKPTIQMVLYVGDGKPNMKTEIIDPLSHYRYLLKDIKEIECKELLDSDSIEDKILAVLWRVENFERYMNGLIDELLKMSEKERADNIRKLLIALDYRPKLKVKLRSLMEGRKMPLTITEEMIKQDPFFELGLERGLKEGEKRGLEKGKEIGKEIGIEIGQKLLIERLIKKGKSLEEISELLDIPIEKIRKLLEKN